MRLAHAATGDGPLLLLLHGGSGRRQWFDGLLPLLADQARCVTVDLPGHGESPWDPATYPIGRAAEEVAHLLEQMGPACVFGHSHGGHVALVLAARRPELVRALALGDTPLDMERLLSHWQTSAPMTRAWRDIARETNDPLVAAQRLVDVPAPGGETLGALFGLDHPYLVEMGHSLAAHDPVFLDLLLEQPRDLLAGLEPARQLAELRCPVLLLQADATAGGLLAEEDVALVKGLAKDCTLRQLEGVSHGLQLQAPLAVATALTPWLQRQAASS